MLSASRLLCADLVGVQSVLRSWGASDHLTNAALFHSIYGTEGFQGYKLPLSHRGEIAELIGPRAERLAWIFCMVDRASVDATLTDEGVLAGAAGDKGGTPACFYARSELGAFPMPLKDHAEWLDFLTLSLADWLEQVGVTAAVCNHHNACVTTMHVTGAALRVRRSRALRARRCRAPSAMACCGARARPGPTAASVTQRWLSCLGW